MYLLSWHYGFQVASQVPGYYTTSYHFIPLGVLLNPGIKTPTSKSDQADSRPDEPQHFQNITV